MMWWTALSACIVLGLLIESRRRLLAVRASWRVAAPFLERAAPGPHPASAAASGTPLGEPSALQRRQQVADLNEATVEVRAGLARAGGVAQSCAKAALSLGALVALLQSAELVQGSGSAWLAPAVSFAGGCAGALGCACIGRRAEAEAQRLRADWAALIRRSARDVAS